MCRVKRRALHQLVRKVVFQLDHELMSILRGNRGEFRNMRASANAAALELAIALEKPIYDSAAVQTVIDKFSTGRESLAAKAGAVVTDIIAKLTAEERMKLAAAIRDRSAREVQQ